MGFIKAAFLGASVAFVIASLKEAVVLLSQFRQKPWQLKVFS